MFEGVNYQQLMVASHIVAGTFNGQRSKRSDRWFTFEDFHPEHAKPERGLSGDEVNRRVTAEMEATGTVVWLEDES